MKKLTKILGVIALVLGVASCNGTSNSGSETEVVSFDGVKVDSIATNCDAKCEIKLDFKFAKGGAVAEAINSAIINCGMIPKECAGDGKGDNMPKVAKDVVGYYAKVFGEDEVVLLNAEAAFYYNATSGFSYGRDSVINYYYSYDSYMGGVRNEYQMVALNFDPKTGALIKLKDFIKLGSEDKIIEMIVAQVAIHYDCASLQDLQDNHMIFSNFDPYVPENFVIGKDSVEFVYNCEEVAPYAVGDITVKFSYNDLADCLK